MVAAILGAVAEMEGEMVQERTASIVALKRERGQSLGGRPRKIPVGICERIVAERAAGTPSERSPTG
jgi:DNA invertase Pin-like site-specific DNA recombinase